MSQHPRLLLAAAASLLPVLVAAQDPATPRLITSGIELTLGGRLQTQFATTSVDGESPSELFIRRARIELGVKVDDRVSGVVHPEFGNDDVELKDAYLKLTFSPGLQFLAGKAYRPFGLLEQTSSKRILPIERGLRIRGLAARDEYALTSGLSYSNRDIGVQVLGTPEGNALGFSYAAGVFRGPLHGEVGDQDSYQFAARVTVRPASALRLGAGWSSRDFSDGVGTTPDLERGNAFEVDLEYGTFAPGVHVLAEVSRGDLDPFTDATFWGAHLWLAFRSRALGASGTMLEPVFRASYAETESDVGATVVPGGTLLTPGINLYLGALNRLMLNYDYWLGADGSEDARSVKAMFQLGF
jgi:hypothetical protein